ncbi:fungal hydrophobin-domain-containing protein [Mycena capillaripes]|nr:fungal hydrophobin-domain-containing protein [Mycena capillaripes]KAJ6545669.1 fungal hydrophobin-domain-containing protein [Mycena capillaripes]
MQFLLVAAAFSLTAIPQLVAASPLTPRLGSVGLCPAGFFNAGPQCCEASALTVLATECSTPDGDPQTKKAFTKSCSKKGLTAKCCSLSAAGVSIICQNA